MLHEEKSAKFKSEYMHAWLPWLRTFTILLFSASLRAARLRQVGHRNRVRDLRLRLERRAARRSSRRAHSLLVRGCHRVELPRRRVHVVLRLRRCLAMAEPQRLIRCQGTRACRKMLRLRGRLAEADRRQGPPAGVADRGDRAGQRAAAAELRRGQRQRAWVWQVQCGHLFQRRQHRLQAAKGCQPISAFTV